MDKQYTQLLDSLIKPFEKFTSSLSETKFKKIFGSIFAGSISFVIFLGDRKEIESSLKSEFTHLIFQGEDFDLYRFVRGGYDNLNPTLMVFSEESFKKYKDKFKNTNEVIIQLKLKVS